MSLLRAFLVGVATSVLLGCPPGPALAQSGSETSTTLGSPQGPILSLLAGVQGTDPSIHAFGGVGIGYMASERWGAEGVGLVGSGTSFESAMAGGGPSFRALRHPNGEIRLWAGPAWYRESWPQAEPRSVLAGVAGAFFRVPLPRAAFTGGLLYWRGSLDEEDFRTAVTVDGFRFMLGLGL